MKPIYQMATIAGGIIGAMIVLGLFFLAIGVYSQQQMRESMRADAEKMEQYERKVEEREKAIQDGTFWK